jgi:rSAM/selenodomain-associated transferase 1
MILLWHFWPGKWGPWQIIVCAVFLRICMMPVAAGDDVNRYIWEGKIQNHGYNPYELSPNDAELVPLRDAIWENINHKDIPAIYGPFSELVFRFCSSISQSLLFFKIVFTLFDLGTLVFLLLLMRTWSIAIRHAVLYACNPLVLFSIAGEGHLESLVVFWLVGSLYFFRKNKPWPAFIFFGLSLASKITPVFLIPFLLTRKNVSKSWLIAVPLMLYLPYYTAAGSFLSVPFRFVSAFHFNGLVNNMLLFFMSESNSSLASWCICMVCLGFVFFFEPNRFRAFYYAICVFLLCSTTVHPGYVVLLTPFLVLYRSPALILLHLTIGASFLVRIHYLQTGLWHESLTIWLIEYAPFAAVGIWCWLRNAQKDPVTFLPPKKLSIIIPVFNEQENILECINSFPNNPAIDCEIIVADGGSTDATVDKIKDLSSVRLVRSARGRGIQIKRALEEASGDTVLVLHADSRPGPGIVQHLIKSLHSNPGIAGGSFHTRYASPRFQFTINTFLNNLRTLFTGISFGDQGQFFRREAIGDRFPASMLMEDVELSFLLKEAGAILFLRQSIVNSTRTWEKHGYIRNLMTVVLLTLFYVINRRLWYIKDDCRNFYDHYYNLRSKTTAGCKTRGYMKHATTVVFAKVPRPGFVKTRISSTNGIKRAHEIYLDLLDITAQTVSKISHHVAFIGSPGPDELKSYFPNAESFFPQSGSDLGQRLKNAFLHLSTSGYAVLCAIGCDCPHLETGDIMHAFEGIDSGNDVVIGPAQDGGYYLIACRASSLCIFDVHGWGTPGLFEETMALCKKKTFRVALLDKKFDIDTMKEYNRWKKS